MPKEIITVGIQYPGFEDNYKSFFSYSSLKDADIVIFNSNSPKVEYRPHNCHNAKECFPIQESILYEKFTSHWKNELNDYFEDGKCVYFILNDYQDFYLSIPDKPWAERSTYDILKSYVDVKFTQSNGSKFVLKNKKLFSDFDKAFQDHLEYKACCELNPKIETIYNTKNDKYCVSFLQKIKNGYLVALPDIKQVPELDLADKLAKALEGSKPDEVTLAFYKSLINNIKQIDDKLNVFSEKTPPPEWTKEEIYKTSSEKTIEQSINISKIKFEQLRTEIETEEVKLTKITDFKDLLFETGKPLESAINKSLRLLDYTAENFNDGELELDGVIISPEGHRYIGEYTAKDNSDVKTDKISQLVREILEDADRDIVEDPADGILFGNPQRLIPVEDRKLDFTTKCKTISKKSSIALVRTSDLFNVVKYLIDNPDDEAFKKQCRDAILNGLGKIVQFPKPQED